MATNPSVNVTFQDGSLGGALNTADEVCLKIGAAADGPYLTPLRVSSTSSALRFRHGPLVRSAAHHADYSGALYLMRGTASTPGTVSSVTKTPGSGVLASLGTLSLALQSYTLHAQVDAATAGSALSISTGWQDPGTALPLKVTSGPGTVAHTQVVTYVNSAGNTISETLTISGAGTVTTTGDVARVLSVTSNVAPVGTQDYTATWAGPGDRYNAVATCVTGGVLGVSGGTTPTWRLSLDGGVTTSRTYPMPSTGVVELTTYAGGLTPQSLGLAATWSAGSLAQTIYGGIRVAGGTVNGDVVYNLLASGVTVTHVVSGNNTPLSVSVVASAITVTSATNGGGTATTTGAALVAFILTDGSAGAIAARALVLPVAVGTGLGVLAAAVSAGATNGGVTCTAKVEGVTVRTVNSGSGKTHSVTVVGKAITLYADTDANGAQTTTATNAAAYLNADATASALGTFGASGTGAGIIGCTGTYTSLPVSVATGDKFTFTTTPPAMTDADVQAALNALLANESALANFSILHLVGEATDSIGSVVATFVGNAASRRKQFKAAVLEGTYMGSTAEATWATAIKAAFPTRSTVYGICAGEVNAVCSAYGTVDRVNVAAPYVARLMTCPLSELPSHTDCDTLVGIKGALDGVPVRSFDGDPPLWQSDDALTDLNTSNFVTARVHPGRSGVYVRQGLMYTDEGSDYLYVSNRRVANVAAALAYDEGLRFLSANLLSDPASGQLAESECQKFESQIGDRVRKKLCGNDNGRQHVASAKFIVDRGVPYTGAVTGKVVMVPRRPVTTLSIPISFSNTSA